MNRELATRITTDYFKAWIEQNMELFLSLLDSDIVIKECTGDMYIGKDVAEKWFQGWHSGGNRVLSWDIDSHYFDDKFEVVTASWNFRCLYDAVEYTFDGVTIIRFNHNLIVKLDEYQMEVEKKYPYSD